MPFSKDVMHQFYSLVLLYFSEVYMMSALRLTIGQGSGSTLGYAPVLGPRNSSIEYSSR
ncbi:hypothetical protein RSAG8_08142, partial [Rhizoctonia solani AG-8 WAC10335]